MHNSQKCLINPREVPRDTLGFNAAAIRNLIREAKVAQMYSAIQTSRKDGMQTLDQNLKELVDKGLITTQEASAKAFNKDLF